MNDRASSRAVSKIAAPKNGAASRGVFIIPRKRDKLSILMYEIRAGINAHAFFTKPLRGRGRRKRQPAITAFGRNASGAIIRSANPRCGFYFYHPDDILAKNITQETFPEIARR
jgi:hypothetical protein